ncbi:MAG: primosomal protein N' [Deltaproteobacteria bacterium]|nr:primosomal protein N' [Deltaproteobacteria bacterium]
MADHAIRTLRVALALPVKETFRYSVPDRFVTRARVGCRVLAPFRTRTVTGYILDAEDRPPRQEELKDILDVLDEEPLFHGNLVPFFDWTAEYYLYPVGRLIQAALPGGINAGTLLVCSLTTKGSRALELIGLGPEEGKALAWIRGNPGRGLPVTFRRILPALSKRGWVAVEKRVTKRRTGPLMKSFVRAAQGIELPSVLRESQGANQPKGEGEFLAAVFGSRGISLAEICRRFPNGAYLVRKWGGKGVLETYSAPVLRGLAGNILFPSPPPERLFDQQQKVLSTIRGFLQKGHFGVCLLHGVTGSGKTEVYFRAVRSVIELGRKAILMVPEIALAMTMEGIFRSRLGERLAVYHSGLGEGERFDQWMRMARGEVDLVIGARSALFAPLTDLGLVIVDEEHDSSYKQEEAPRYQARDAAVARGKIEKALVILGSGTPSVQSFHNALTGRYHFLTMPDRVEKRPLPVVRVVDMKALPEGKGNLIITPALREALERTLAEAKQAILFLNRRGFNRVHLCRHCGHSLRCPNCDLSLIYHRKDARLACHYCGFHAEPQGKCPSCGREGMKAYGFGTERLEEQLKDNYPGCRTGRLDRDVTRLKGESFRILRKFGNRELDFLVGTQMITKGYDFPHVTLVGVISADASLDFPDFRAAERTFQLLSQVAGRAGRGDHRGEVIIQTFNPEHYAVTAARDHDYRTFFDRERELREQLGYPPYSYVACLRLQGNSPQVTANVAQRVGAAMNRILARWPRKGKEIQVLGPAEAPLAKLKGKHRWQILVKSKGAGLLHYFLNETDIMSRKILRSSGVGLTIDVDPYQML